MNRREQIVVSATKVKNAKYDVSAKAILRYPKLIAPILKNVVPEFKNYSVDEVIDFIVKDSISSTTFFN